MFQFFKWFEITESSNNYFNKSELQIIWNRDVLVVWLTNSKFKNQDSKKSLNFRYGQKHLLNMRRDVFLTEPRFLNLQTEEKTWKHKSVSIRRKLNGNEK